MSNRTIVILDAADKVLASAPATSGAQRISVRCAADQRQIDSMFIPGAVRAEVRLPNGVAMSFKFDAAGRSQFVFKS